ncbi:MAG: radical SAM protein [Pseudomonadota bacterium]
MISFQGVKEQAISSNFKEYGERSQWLRWLSSPEAKANEKIRDDLLSALEPHVQYGYNHTKLDCARLSAGCRSCGGGEWSCLFINGKCNCRCFYCPTEQDRIGVPTTNGIQFHKPGDYADYVAKFQFKGVSISGGEPLLTVDTSLKYISAVRKKLGDRIYIWLYTNGTLSTPTILSRLRDAGLNEIRFDIGATHYTLEKAREAIGVIPVVTVEIPAIPEDLNLLKMKLTEMAEVGISHLHLHQLRLTPFNFEKLKDRNYTFLHGEKVTVLESELTALELLRFSFEEKIPLPINYCTFHYKHSFQGAAVRKRSAAHIIKKYEDLTEKGYIRSLSLVGNSEALLDQVRRFGEVAGSGMWLMSGSGGRLYFSALLIDFVSTSHAELKVAYFEPRILSGMTYRHAYVELPINKRKSVVVEKAAVCEDMALKNENIARFRNLVSNRKTVGMVNSEATSDPVWEKILQFEMIRPGLQPYF